MPVPREQLESYLNELGLSDAARAAVLGDLTTNDTAATQFVGQRLRHDDYTRKTQEAAQLKAQIEANANNEITKYAQQLADAQSKVNQIMGDFERESISRATAEARLNKVKTVYNLSDEDIPTVTTPAQSAATPTPQIDVQKALADMRADLLKEFRSDMMSLPRLAVLQNDIAMRHQQLTGKPLTREDFNNLIDKAEKERRPLETVWQEEFKIPELQTKQLVDAAVTAAKQKWEDDQKIANTNAALASVSSAATPERFTQSPILQRNYVSRVESTPSPANTPAPTSTTSNAATPPPTPGVKLSGADRAATVFIERRSNGIPLGAAPITK